MPYRFRDDLTTADVAFEAWGNTREEAFIASAAALLHTMVERPELVERREEIMIRIEEEELDLLLWSFLQEIVYFKDARRLLLHAQGVRIEQDVDMLQLTAVLRGEQIDPARHRMLVDVKAVTLHRLQAAYSGNGWKTVAVLDV